MGRGTEFLKFRLSRNVTESKIYNEFIKHQIQETGDSSKEQEHKYWGCGECNAPQQRKQRILIESYHMCIPVHTMTGTSIPSAC